MNSGRGFAGSTPAASAIPILTQNRPTCHAVRSGVGLTSFKNRRTLRLDTEARKCELAEPPLLSDAKEFCGVSKEGPVPR